METSILTILIAVPSAAFTALGIWLIAQRRIEVENITQERAKWRKKIRARASNVDEAILNGNKANLRCLKIEFWTFLNPFDSDDRAILDCMIAAGSRRKRKARADQFAERVSLLLKHDWERAKLEAGLFPWRWFLEAKRQPWTPCGIRTDLRWWEKYKISLSREAVAAAILIVALCIAAFALCHCQGCSVAKKKATHMLLTSDAYKHEPSNFRELEPLRHVSWHS